MNEKESNCVRCGYCCTEMEINILDLVFPKQLLPPKGLEFYNAHGLDKVLENNSKVRVLHTCQWLKDGNFCLLEGKNKPAYCKEWVCRRHLRDSEWFKNRNGELALDAMMDIVNTIDTRGTFLSEDTFRLIIDTVRRFKRNKNELEGKIELEEIEGGKGENEGR